MKKNLLTLGLITLSVVGFSQNRYHTPQQVQESFKKDHPGHSNARWTQTNGNWHTTYRDNNRNVDAYYDKNGKNMYSRTSWNRKDMSANYDKKIRSRYHTTNYRVTKIDRPDNTSLFELILNLAGRNRTVYTDENGNEVKYRPGY